MDYGRKRKMTFITLGLFFLLSGVEYAVILPTIWHFLQTLDAEPYFLGVSLSAFSLSGLISGPLFGFWSDRTHSTKKIILFANCFEIIGNFMYFAGFSKWLLLSSRFVAGIGTGAGSSIFGFLTRITAFEDRPTVFAAFMVCRQAGLLIGPAFNIFLRLCDFQLGPFVVNKYTAPGIFMCVLWVLLQFIVLLMYWDLRGRNEGAEEEKQEEEERLLVRTSDHCETYGTLPNSAVVDQTIANGNLTLPSPDVNQIRSSPFKNFSAAREFLREEVVVLLTAQFITLFNQTALETMVTPLTQQYFNFGELENSAMYGVCGVEVIAGFLFVRWISRKLEEREVLSIGIFLSNVSCVWCLIFLTNPQGGFSWQLTEFIIGLFLQVLGLPFIAVAQVSLFSKVTAEKTQGFSQGIRRSVGGLATILGPLWAGSLTSNLYVMLGVTMGLLTLLTIMVAFSYNRLVERITVEPSEE